MTLNTYTIIIFLIKESIDMIKESILDINMNKNHSAFNIRLMDTEKYMSVNRLKPVTTSLIKLPSTNTFHPDGFFSEEIFSQIGTEQRFTQLGYIKLNTAILHPIIYKIFVDSSALYKEIMSSRTFARFDLESSDFVRVDNVEETSDEVDTGYAFFMRYIEAIKLKDTGSPKRQDDIELLNKYKKEKILYNHIVLPAGVRDISLDDNGVMIQDDINKLYSVLLSYTNSIPENTTSHLYDTVRYQMQLKAYEIYAYIRGITDGKRGFFQGQYTARKITLGTRNVISAANYNVKNIKDPQLLKSDEVKLGLYQTMKGMQPLLVYGIRNYLIDPIFTNNPNITTIPLINPKTLELEYKDISDEVRLRFTSENGIGKMINNFLSTEQRDKSVTVRTADNKNYYMCLVYDLGDRVYYFKSLSDLRVLLRHIDKTKIRPLRYSEIFYVITHSVSLGKHVLVTRYPVLGERSVCVSKIHLCTTNPSRVVKLYNLLDQNQSYITYPEYPVFGNDYIDTTILSVYKLAGLGADFDGDMVSVNFVLTQEANAECNEFLNSTKELINTQRSFNNSFTDLMKLVLSNITMRGHP